MTFDQFLEWHQSIIQKRTAGKEVTEEMEEFICFVNTKIESYCEIADELRRNYERWELKAKRLTQLRNGFVEKE